MSTLTAEDTTFLASLQTAGGAGWKPATCEPEGTTCARFYNEIADDERCPCGCVVPAGWEA
jgi:hypothetical protein